MTEHFFTTTAGIKIPIQPVSLLDLELAKNTIEKQFREDSKPIDPPTYAVEVLGGEKEYHPHTEKTIEEGTEQEKENWQAHLEAVEEMQDELQSRTGLVILEGIIFDLPEDDSWIKRRKKLFDEDVPEDEDEKKLYYVNNVLLKTLADKANLSLEIQLLSMTGATPEAIKAYEELFRGQMEIAGRKATEELKTKLKEQEKLVLQSTIEGRTSSENEGIDDAPVPPVTDRGSGGNNSSGERAVQDDGVGTVPRPTRKRQAKTKKT